MARPTASDNTTRWGDREGRRRDILCAAEALMREKGVAGLNMRAVAQRAGLSPGAAYFYFGTKEEIFLTVYAGHVDELGAAAARDCAAAGTVLDLFRAFAATYLRFYRDYGRELNPFALVSDPQAVAHLPPELIERLRARVLAIFALMAARIGELAHQEKLELRADRLAMPLLWIVLGGLAENFSGPRSEAHPYGWDEMVDFAGRTLLTGLTARSITGDTA